MALRLAFRLLPLTLADWEGREVLGRHWFDASKINVRLLTDPEERVVNKDTALRFAEKGTIKKQRGLHAKLFIVDDQVLLTPANLTYSAFARGHEIGVGGPIADKKD